HVGVSLVVLAEFQVVGPPDPLIALAGSDLVLPCSVQPSTNAVDMNIEWSRLDSTKSLVHVYRDGEDQSEGQDPSYRGRTALFKEELEKGNASLLLTTVRVSDEGKYRCHIRGESQDGDYTAEVRVEAIGTHPLITVESYDSSGGVRLLCESKGWWPKPDLEWLDSDGNSLNGVTETHRDKESISVTHRITVHNGVSNRFYCRAKLRNHMMEAEVNVSGQMFHAWKTKVAWIIIFVLLVVGLIGCIIWREERREQEENERVQEVQTYLNRGGTGRLSGASLSPAQWSVVVLVLLKSKEDQEEFDLRKYDPSEKCLLKLLPVANASQRVVLEGCSITDEGCAALFKALKSNPSLLRELNLNNNKPGDSGVKELSNLLGDPDCKLEKLQLDSCNITDEGCTTLFKALQSNPSHLRELNLNINKPGNSGVKELSDLLQDPHCKLEKLLLEGCIITDEGCAALFKALKSKPSQLRELNLNNNKPGDLGVTELSDLLKSSDCKLEKLLLESCCITDEGFAVLLKALKSNPSLLRELNLNYNNPEDSGVKELSDLLKNSNCKLEKLHLSGCSITGEGCAALFKALKSNSSSHLTELNMNYNKPGQPGVKKLSELLEDSHCKLEKLQLERCSITDEGCTSLVKALKSNKSSNLTELNLNYNNPGDEGVKRLSDLLKSSQCKLESLQLCYCSITDDGCSALASALKSNPTSQLRELNLNNNKPGDSGVRELSGLLEDPHCKLEKLQ
ncbi:hypothetical protein NFI96_022099, partial [Prochilodus magdalenae]